VSRLRYEVLRYLLSRDRATLSDLLGVFGPPIVDVLEKLKREGYVVIEGNTVKLRELAREVLTAQILKGPKLVLIPRNTESATGGPTLGSFAVKLPSRNYRGVPRMEITVLHLSYVTTEQLLELAIDIRKVYSTFPNCVRELQHLTTLVRYVKAHRNELIRSIAREIEAFIASVRSYLSRWNSLKPETREEAIKYVRSYGEKLSKLITELSIVGSKSGN